MRISMAQLGDNDSRKSVLESAKIASVLAEADQALAGIGPLSASGTSGSQRRSLNPRKR